MAANAQIPGYAKTLMAIATVFMPVFLILPFFIWGNENNEVNLAEQDIQRGRLAPVGRLTIAGDNAAADTATAAAFDPEATYNSVCAACHATGVLNAPKFGEKAPWQAKIDERGSIDALIEQGIKGLNAMPPKGGATISDENFATAVKYMLAHSGFEVEYASGGGTTSADAAAAEQPVEAAPSEAPAAEQPAEAAPSEAPAAEQPAEAAANEAPAAEQPAEAAPSEAPAVEQPAEAAPSEAPAVEQPAEAAPSETPAAEQPAEANTQSAS